MSAEGGTLLSKERRKKEPRCELDKLTRTEEKGTSSRSKTVESYSALCLYTEREVVRVQVTLFEEVSRGRRI